MMAILASSEGWNCTNPTPSHRRDPLTVTANGLPGMASRNNSPNETPTSGSASSRSRRWSKRDITHIATAPIPTNSACLVKKRYGVPPVSSDFTADADNTINRPMAHSAATSATNSMAVGVIGWTGERRRERRPPMRPPNERPAFGR